MLCLVWTVGWLVLSRGHILALGIGATMLGAVVLLSLDGYWEGV